MATRLPFLNESYSAYYHRDVPKEDEDLTHVGPGTPCGEYMRRFWQPVALLEELQDLPQRIRILGEDLVVFRDRSGRVGLLELHCAHRGTSLEYGLISECGIRCCYHGWLYDIDGKILDTPGEPSDSTLKDRLYHGAYPTQVHKGLVFAYMGDPDKRPPFPRLDTMVEEGSPGYRPSAVTGGKHIMPCNWLQIKENSMDPVHTSFLHTIVSGSQFTDEFGIIPELDFMETPVGMVYIATRRVGDNAWVRMNDFIPPNIHQVGQSSEDGKEVHGFRRPWLTHWCVPVDDTHTRNIRIRHYEEGEFDAKARPPVMTFGQTDERPYEDRQRVPGDFDAQSTIHWGISRHAMERLAYTDRGITMLRDIVRKGVQAVKAGQEPNGAVIVPGDITRTYSNDTVVRVPPAATPEEDAELLRQAGRRVAEGYINNPLPL